MPKTLENIPGEIRREAEMKFLGKNSVVAISQARNDREYLVFMLSRNSRDVERSIRNWASSRHIRADVKVIGRFNPL